MNITIESSYQKNNIGDVIYQTVLRYKPKVVIDFGVLYGYSTICMAMALKEIGEGHVSSYDLWDKYPYKHTAKEVAEENVKTYGLSDWVTLGQMDFYEWIDNPTHFDFMHLDISNDGDVIEKAYDKLKYFLNSGSAIIFEGGTEERDNQGWMIEYNKTPMLSIKEKTGYTVIAPLWPGLSIIEGTL